MATKSLLREAIQDFIVAAPDETLIDALEKLDDKNGDDHWLLVIASADGTYRAATFEALRAAGPAALDTPLSDLTTVLQPAPAVDRSTSYDEAAKLAAGSASGVAVVTWGGDVIRVLQAETAAQSKTATVNPESPSPSSAPDKPAVRNILTTIKDNWIVTALVVVLVTLIPTLFTYLEIFDKFVPTLMAGEWNVAVASFTEIGDENVTRNEIRSISDTFHNRLAAEMGELADATNILIEVRAPTDTGTINGDTPEERAANAESLARRVNANMVVYGTIERRGDTLLVTPEFYVNVRNFYEAQEMLGQHALGGTISGADIGVSQVNLNRELARRAEALSLITSGLGLYYVHDYDAAQELFAESNQNDFWPSNTGREVVYLFEGNAAMRVEDYDAAIAAFNRALDIEPGYSRAYAGLGGATYVQALADATTEEFQLNETLVNQALLSFQNALDAPIQPTTADIPVKVAFGRGQIYMVQWLAGEDTRDAAVSEFETVLALYGNGANERVIEFAAESNARLATIYRHDGDYQRAIQYYLAASELSTSPDRRSLYYGALADLYAVTEDFDNSETYNRLAIDDLFLARSLISDPLRQAEYWAQQATRHERLGETGEAVSALRSALDLLEEDSPLQEEVQARLDELLGTQTQ